MEQLQVRRFIARLKQPLKFFTTNVMATCITLHHTCIASSIVSLCSGVSALVLPKSVLTDTYSRSIMRAKGVKQYEYSVQYKCSPTIH